MQPTSREHHFGLLLCWKIREGLRLDVAPKRIKRYAEWYWENYLIPHFGFEERYILPILGSEHELAAKTKEDHRRLHGLFLQRDNLAENLRAIEKELTAHIRFEERTLFNEVQRLATEEQLEAMACAHAMVDELDWEDEFWVSEQR